MVEGKLLGTFLVLYGGGFFTDKRCTRRVSKSCYGRFLFYTVEDFLWRRDVLVVKGKLLGTFPVLYGGGFWIEKR